MLTRSIKSMVTFSNPFAIASSDEKFPPGTYDILAEEELLPGLSFDAYRRTATYLLVSGKGKKTGQTTMHITTPEDLDCAIAHDRALCETTQNSDAALSAHKDTT